jgi:hypothetical protein
MLSVLPTPEELVKEADTLGWEWRMIPRSRNHNSGCLLSFLGVYLGLSSDPSQGYSILKLHNVPWQTEIDWNAVPDHGITLHVAYSLEAGFENYPKTIEEDEVAYNYGKKVRELVGYEQ